MNQIVRFGGISGEFGRAMVLIPRGRPNEPDMPPKRTRKVTIRYLPYPNSAKSGDIFSSYGNKMSGVLSCGLRRE